MEAQRQTRGDGLFVAKRENGLQELGIFVPDHDVEDVVVDEALDAFGDGAQQDGVTDQWRKVAADFLEEREGFGLFVGGGEETGRKRVRVAERAEKFAFG